MKIIVSASDSGSLKEIICTRGTDTSKQSSIQPDSITNYCAETRATRILQFTTYKDKYIIATRAGGSISIYDFSYELVRAFSGFGIDPKDSFISLFIDESKAYACTESGQVVIIDVSDLDKEVEKLQLPTPNSQNMKNVTCFTVDPTRHDLFAFGGKDNDVKVVKREGDEFKIVFKAKNMPNNKIDLREPVWVKKIEFVADESDDNDAIKLVVVTGYGQLRTYDSTKTRRPVMNFKISTNPLITLQIVKSESCKVICSDARTTTAKFNYETGRMDGKFPGSVGSIQAIHIFEKSNLLVTGGLDRYVRCFDIATRECVAKVYVGTQISDVIILEDDQPDEKKNKLREMWKKKKQEALKEAGEEKEQEEEEEESTDEEGMWTKLEDNLAKTRKRRRLQLKE